MPIGKVHIDAALSNLSIAYQNGKSIIRRILLPFPVEKKSDRVYKYGQEIFLSEDDARAAGAEPTDSTPQSYTDIGFSCSGHAQHDKVARDTSSNADPALNLIADTTMMLTAKGNLNEEVAGAAAIATIMAGYTANQAATPWNSPDVDPYKTLKAYIDTITLACGTPPNVLALSQPVWTAIRTNPNIIGLVTGAPAVPNARVTLEQFAELLELDEVIVGRMVYNTKLGGTKKFVWGQNALLFYRPASPGLRSLAIGYTPVWIKALASVSGLEKVPGMDGAGDQFVQQYYWEPDLSDHIVVHRYYDQMTVAPECGQLFTNCLGGE